MFTIDRSSVEDLFDFARRCCLDQDAYESDALKPFDALTNKFEIDSDLAIG